jgi:transmembrane sensor
MSEPSWAELGKKIDPRWASQREHWAREMLERGVTKRRSLVRVAAAAAAVSLVAGGVGAVGGRPTPAPVVPSAAAQAPSLAAPVSWRPLAESGSYAEARVALKEAGPNAVRDDTTDLLLASDTTRLGGYPAEAVPYLERVVRQHTSDPRSSLASFTLGRVFLDELGRPREAAEAFARARRAGGPLAEDALAREVEAASRAGDTTGSRELAREYLTRYPKGRRLKAVTRFGGLG